MNHHSGPSRITFIDVFAGCGGLSLGLMQAGLQGLFAIEKDPGAFETLSTNLLGPRENYSFEWPSWLPKEAICVTDFLRRFENELIGLRGKVDLLVGGPPCQGYSCAGRRDTSDPRNALFDNYLKLVGMVQPTVVLVENVRGMTQDFKDGQDDTKPINYAQNLVTALESEYVVHSKMLDLSKFGVPQSRTRFFVIGIRKGASLDSALPINPFDLIEASVFKFLSSKGLTAPLPSKAALSDLEVTRNGVKQSEDTVGFNAIAYSGPITPYQRLMRFQSVLPPSDTRLPNHRQEIVERFAAIIEMCHADGRLNTSITKESRAAFGLRKNAIRVLDPDRPAPTVTSMPDDLIHYKEPRTLTVRENARLQSFPDWFVFRGQYTTGGHRRRLQVPRYTQVANAVPPLAAEAIGLVLSKYLAQSSRARPKVECRAFRPALQTDPDGSIGQYATL